MSDCIFCKIIDREIPGEIIYEDDEILAFKDINPLAPIHILIIPKKHIESLDDISTDDIELIGRLHIVAQKIARDLGMNKDGYRLVNNCGGFGGQMVYHLHYHLLGGVKLSSFGE